MAYSGVQQEKDGSVVLFVNLPQEFYNDLRQSASEEGISVIEFVKLALENEIYEPGDSAPPSPK